MCVCVPARCSHAELFVLLHSGQSAQENVARNLANVCDVVSDRLRGWQLVISVWWNFVFLAQYRQRSALDRKNTHEYMRIHVFGLNIISERGDIG